LDKYIGRLLDNRYEILEVIGTGGMAVVYKARCHRLNRLVAIKILKDDYLEDEDFRRRFHAESQAVAMLSHPNIVAVYDVSTSVMADYIVMELIDGITLKQYMEKKGVLNWKETLHFAIQIAKALEHAHSRGIVHRDIKPHNVMVLKNGSVKVADFGIARMMSKGNTLTKEALGSVHYISPEQAKGGRVDVRSDIYSLGVVMYEMMTGRPPYDGDSPVAVAIQHINGGAVMPSTLNPNIPGGLEQIIMKAMAHSPEDRYTSATEMLRDMDEFRKTPGILFDYNTPPLDIVTRLQRPAAPESQPKTTAEKVAGKADQTGRQSKAKPREDLAERSRNARQQRHARAEEKRSRAATIAIVSCSLVAIIAIAIFLITLFGEGLISSTKMVPVPNLVGKYYDQLPVYDGLKVEIGDSRYDDTYPAGQIIEQQPSGGEIERDRTIFVVVSLGEQPQIIKMINLVNFTQDRATDYLNSLSLNLQIETEPEFSEDIPEGTVIRTEPAEDTELESGQTVTLWVSMGPETELGEMPGVVGMDVDKAVYLLNARGFFEWDTEMVESDEEKDTVVEQSVAEGEMVDIKTKIILKISKGPEPTQPPETDPPKPTQPPETEPLVEKTIVIRLDGETVESYRLSLRQGNEEVYAADVLPETVEIEITLSGSGIQHYDVYIGETYAWTERVDFTAP